MVWDSWWFVGLFVVACGLHVTVLSPGGTGRWYALAFVTVAVTFALAAVMGMSTLAIVAVAGFVLLVLAGRPATLTRR